MTGRIASNLTTDSQCTRWVSVPLPPVRAPGVSVSFFCEALPSMSYAELARWACCHVPRLNLNPTSTQPQPQPQPNPKPNINPNPNPTLTNRSTPTPTQTPTWTSEVRIVLKCTHTGESLGTLWELVGHISDVHRMGTTWCRKLHS